MIPLNRLEGHEAYQDKITHKKIAKSLVDNSIEVITASEKLTFPSNLCPQTL